MNDVAMEKPIGQPYSRVGSVNSVAEYLGFVSDPKLVIHPDFHSTSISSKTWYRGHSDANWELAPRLYREGLFNSERDLIRDSLRLAPHEFAGLGRLQVLAKLQHYGMPTRLLDVTGNPLVALYFACGGTPDVDGEVWIFRSIPTNHEGSDPVRAALDYIFLFPGTPRDDGWMAPAPHLVHYLTLPGLAVLPTFSNPRILAQDGSFFIGGMLRSEEGYEARPINMGIEALRLQIPGKSKSQMLSDLDRINVNERALFPELEAQLRYVYRKYGSGAWSLPRLCSKEQDS